MYKKANVRQCSFFLKTLAGSQDSKRYDSVYIKMEKQPLNMNQATSYWFK